MSAITHQQFCGAQLEIIEKAESAQRPFGRVELTESKLLPLASGGVSDTLPGVKRPTGLWMLKEEKASVRTSAGSE